MNKPMIVLGDVIQSTGFCTRSVLCPVHKHSLARPLTRWLRNSILSARGGPKRGYHSGIALRNTGHTVTQRQPRAPDCISYNQWIPLRWSVDQAPIRDAGVEKSRERVPGAQGRALVPMAGVRNLFSYGGQGGHTPASVAPYNAPGA
jgi:hypothetical protein